MTEPESRDDLLMLSGVTATCADCGDERIFVPAGDGLESAPGEYCCTTCDAAVFLLTVVGRSGAARGVVRSHVA